MGFGDLQTDAGLQALNNFLAEKSYLEGYVPSQGDVAVFEALTGPPACELVHALRWYNHIISYSDDEKLAFPGVKKPLDQYGPQSVAKVPAVDSGNDDEDDDDDFDLFGSDDEEAAAEAEKLKEQRLKEYAEKKNKKPALVAKSNIILDVKPWDDETDMVKVEELVRTIEADGLRWAASKLVPLAYGIKKLQISCIVEDDKIGTDFLEEKIMAFEEFVQSVDIAGFNKI